MRFRNTEDEKKSVALRSEMLVAIASRLPPTLATAVMRDLGKLETLIFWEGVRQGLACAALNKGAEMIAGWGMPDLEAMRAPAVLATVYGSADTPLIDIERHHIDRLGQGPEREDMLKHMWLDERPMAFAPSTYAEFMGEKAEPPPMIRVDAPGPPVPVEPFADSTAGKRMEEAFVTAVEAVRTEREPSLDEIRDFLRKADDVAEPSPDSPEIISRTRDLLSGLLKDGWKATSWPLLILTLHRHTGMDASFLDLMLCSEQGGTMLRQLGVNLSPGAGTSMSELAELPSEGPLLTPPAATSDDDGADRS